MLRCPVCLGRDIYVRVGGCTGYVYRCKDCGYEGAFIVEVEDSEHGKNE